jgi:hypothetical protein
MGTKPFVPYGSNPKPARYVALKINLSDPLGGVKEEDLFRPGSLAFFDGYADARESGESGRFIPTNYTLEDIRLYDAGFKAGLKVREHIKSLWLEPMSAEAPSGSG